jgi:protein cornichon
MFECSFHHFRFFFGQVMCLADLEFDYINPYDTASRVNKVMVPEFILQGILSLVLLITGHWIMFLLSLPFVYYDYTL